MDRRDIPRPAPRPGSRPDRSSPAPRAAEPLFPARTESPGDRTTALEGEIIGVTYENDSTGFRVLRVQVAGRTAADTWIGVFPSVPPGTTVRATGRYTRDPRHGEQFRIETLLTLAPSTLLGLERYLGSGMIPGIGPAYAKRIVGAFGERTLDVLDQEPDRLREVAGLGPRRAEAVIKAWSAHRAIGQIMIFLQGHGASTALATRIYKRFGPSAIAIVSRSPYRLALDVWGVGFKTADRIARSIGVGEDAPERAQAGVLQTLHDLSAKGHVFAGRTELTAAAAAMLASDEPPADQAVDALSAAGHVHVEALPDGGAAVYPIALYKAETRLARRLRAILSTEHKGAQSPAPPPLHAAAAVAAFEAQASVLLATAQREAVEQAARHKVLVITGGPGVGKTTIVRAILTLFDRARLRVRLAAPTGRAAKRMSEATGRDATTLHRLLEFDPKQRGFLRRRDQPLEADAIIIDEASMIDLELADALTQAIPDSSRLVLVGDVDQLPSVGPGAVLRDVIASGEVPTVRLSQIFRQAEGSLIVKNAHRIHEGQAPEGARSKDGEFYLIERTTPEQAAETIHEVVTQRIPRSFHLHPVHDVQVLTPMHRGPAGAVALNTMLQGALNPHGPSVSRGNRTLRLGDKVMQLKNDYDRETYNGDVGIIAGIDEDAQTLTVRFYGRDVLYEESDLDELALAYATSIHKSQGSEYPAVVIPILTQHFVMLSRNLLYTAVTRGKKLVVLICDPRALSLALAETRREDRLTRLAERLRQA